MKINKITKVMLLFFVPFSLPIFAEEAVDFNTDFLTDKGIENTDFTKFSYANYIQPGTHLLAIDVNKQRVRNEEPTLFLPQIITQNYLFLVSPQRFIPF